MHDAPFRGKQVHLMGIGGAGMSALVPLLQEVGAQVSGCDLAEGSMVKRLRSQGIDVALGHDPAHINGKDILVHTSAVPPDHEQIRAAHRAGVKVLSRPACLAELMRGTRTLAVAGSHGKSSTTWMIGHMLVNAGHDPVVMVGGSVGDLGHGGARVGRSDWFVAEVDESDGGFQHVEATLAVVTNLEAEHTRHYGGFTQLCEAFNNWLRRIARGGCAILPHEGLDPRACAGLGCDVVRVGIDAGDVHAVGLRLDAEGSSFRLSIHGQDAGEIHVPSPGRHMVENALCAIAAARQVDPQCALDALGSCQRVRRRFTVHGQARGVRIVEDYAHHPTELRAAIGAAALGGGRVHAIFQPHRYTRTADLFKDFLSAFNDAAAVAILPVYAASEEPVAGAGARDLAEAISAHRDQVQPEHRHDLVQYTASGDAAVAFIKAHAQAGDTVLVLGAGDVGRLCRQFFTSPTDSPVEVSA